MTSIQRKREATDKQLSAGFHRNRAKQKREEAEFCDDPAVLALLQEDIEKDIRAAEWLEAEADELIRKAKILQHQEEQRRLWEQHLLHQQQLAQQRRQQIAQQQIW